MLVANPNPLFLPIILVNSAGWLLFAAGLFSLALTMLYRKVLAKNLWLDAVCVGTVGAVAGLNLLLVFGLHLTVPYVSVFKYNYFALPFYCLLAASLATKSSLLIRSTDWKNKASLVKPALIIAGIVLLFSSLLESTLFLLKWVGFASFGVDSVTYYPFDVFLWTHERLLCAVSLCRPHLDSTQFSGTIDFKGCKREISFEEHKKRKHRIM